MAYAPKMLQDLDNPDLDLKDRKNRQEAAVELRVRGANYSEIARVLDYASPNHARQAVERVLASLASEDAREQMRFIMNRRLDRMQRVLWEEAIDTENEGHIAAARTYLAYVDRQCKLNGLDAPTEMVLYTPVSAEIEKHLAELTAQARSEMPVEADIIGEVIEDE